MCKWLRRKRKPIGEQPKAGVEDESRDTPIERPIYPLRYMYPEAIYTPGLPLFHTYYEWGGLPKYLILHHTGGQQDASFKDFHDYLINAGTKNGYCTDFLAADGKIYQQRHGDTGGSHAGKSKWNGLDKLSRHSAGLEIAGGGLLKLHADGTYRTWFNKVVLEENRRYVTKEMGYEIAGWYEKFTKEQELSLAPYCRWNLDNGVEEILGHDQISPKRKNDTGGSLSLPINEWLKKYVL